MVLAVAQVAGTTTFGNGTITATFPSATTTGSLIVAVACVANTGGAGPVAGDISDAKTNTWQVAGGAPFGVTPGCSISCYYNNAGTRGASHTVTVNLANTTSESSQLAIIEITGQDATNATSCFDGTTFATANDITSPFAVTAAAAISGNQIAVYGVSVSGDSGNPAWTDPTGYTVIGSANDANATFVYYAGYKLNETGTPAPAAAWSGTHSASPRELFASFKEAAGGAAFVRPQIIVPTAASARAATW